MTKPRLRYNRSARVYVCWSVEPTTRADVVALCTGYSMRDPFRAYLEWETKNQETGNKISAALMDMLVGPCWRVGLEGEVV